MRSRSGNILIFIGLAVLASLSCLPNPEGPLLEASGAGGGASDPELLFDANFNSIQMNGDFSGVSWSPTDLRNDMKLVADFTWEITASITDTDVADGNIQFKFTHDRDWGNQNIGHPPSGGQLGQAELSDSPNNIVLPLAVDQGFYTFRLNDDLLQYTTDPDAAEGILAGGIGFDGEEPEDGATVTLWALHPEGDMALWDAGDDYTEFSFTGLADSLYQLRVTADGYGAATTDTIRVENGEAPFQNITLSQVFGSISGTVSFDDDPDPLPEAIIVAYEAGTQIEAGRDSSDAAGHYLVGGLSAGVFDLRISAPGYQSAYLTGITVTGDGENDGNDVTLVALSSATPDLPWFSAVVDGSVDEGWDSVAEDPAGDSGWGPTNDFTALHVSWDADNLYVAVAGGFDSGGNTVNVYVDKDYGEGTGVTDFSTLGGGSVADHLRKSIDASGVAGFGADFAGSIWALQYDPEVSDLGDPANVAPLGGHLLAATGDAVEFSVPWLSLYPDMGGGVPPFTELAFYCVIGGGGDEFLADDSLPAVADVTAPDAVIVVQVDSDGD